MSPKADPQIGRVLGSQYRIEALLGQGGMGAVYRAVQLSVQRPVAIKLIHASAANQAEVLTRFRREAEATARLSHPNSVRLFDFGVTEAHEMYMVMELLEGCDLAARLMQGPLAPPEALFIAREVLQALSEAHALGIVHRDLKPGNVFLARVHGGESVVKVMDFGIAGLEASSDGQKLTITGAVMGTPAYMSPEQAQGKPVDGRCDLYSIGVMLFEMLTGCPPFDASTLMSLLLAHVTQPPKRLDEAGMQLPNQAALQRLLDRLLAKNPIDRPPSAAHALAEIEALLAACDAGAPARSQPTPQTSRLGGQSLASARQESQENPEGQPARKTELDSEPPAVAHTTPQETPVGWDVTAAQPAAARAVSVAKAGASARLVGGLAAGAALVALVAFMAMRVEPVVKLKPADDLQPSAAGAASAARLADTLKPRRLLLASSPSGASVSRGGEVLGHTPLALDVLELVEFDLSLPGHVAQRVLLAHDSPERVSIALVPAHARTPLSENAAQGSGKPGAQPEPAHAAKSAGGKNNAGRAPAADEPEPAEDKRETGSSAAAETKPPAPPPRTDSERVRREALLRRAPPFASLAAAQRAYSTRKIDANALQDAVWVLKMRRNERIEIEKDNLKRGAITAQEYEWRLGRIDAELRGE